MLSGILYPVESHIRYYQVHYQLLPNAAATDFLGKYFLLVKCTLITESMTLNIPAKTLRSIIRYYLVSGRICYPVLSGIWYLVEFDIRVNPVSRIR